MMSSTMPSAKYSCSGSPLSLEGQHGDRRPVRQGQLRHARFRPRRVGFRRLVGQQYAVGAHRPFDVLQRLLAEIGEAILHPVAHLSVGILRDADPAGLTDAFEPRGDVDAVAHQVAVALLDHVAEVDADPELDAAIRRHAGIAFAHGVLHLDRAAHRVDDAAELDQRPVSGALDHAPMMHGNRRVDQIAAQRPQPRQRAVLVCSGEPAVADHVGDQDRRDLAGLVHVVLPLSSLLEPDQCCPFST